MCVRTLIVALVLTMGLGLGAAVGAQVYQRPTPVPPKVIEAPDVGFRVEGVDNTTNTPVGQLVVKVNGQWVEARIGGTGGVKQAR